MSCAHMVISSLKGPTLVGTIHRHCWRGGCLLMRDTELMLGRAAHLCSPAALVIASRFGQSALLALRCGLAVALAGGFAGRADHGADGGPGMSLRAGGRD